MNFRKSSEGGEGRGEIISDPKIYVADFCHYKGYFGHEFWNKSATWFSKNEVGGGQRPFGAFPKNKPFWRRHPSLRGFDRTWNLLHQNSELNLFYLRNVRQRFLTGPSVGCLHLFALLSKYVFAFRFVSKFSRSFSHKILLLQQKMQHKYKRYKNVNFNI